MTGLEETPFYRHPRGAESAGSAELIVTDSGPYREPRLGPASKLDHAFQRLARTELQGC